MTRLFAAAACALVSACAHVAPPEDPVLADLDLGYGALRSGDHRAARERLGRALARFDELALDGSALEHALASDPKKPYRGRPHERVLTALLVAALDAEQGRCDMATASLRNARYLAAKATAEDEPALPLADAIARTCADKRALTLELAGSGPTFSATGAHNDKLQVTAGGGREVWARIVIGADAGSLGATPAWSSTFEAQHASGRRFDEVLAERARRKEQANATSRQQLSAGLSEVQSALRDGSVGGDRSVLSSALSTAALHLGAGLAAGAAGAAVDARVDVRAVRGLPEQIVLHAPAQAGLVADRGQ